MPEDLRSEVSGQINSTGDLRKCRHADRCKVGVVGNLNTSSNGCEGCEGDVGEQSVTDE